MKRFEVTMSLCIGMMVIHSEKLFVHAEDGSSAMKKAEEERNMPVLGTLVTTAVEVVEEDIIKAFQEAKTNFDKACDLYRNYVGGSTSDEDRSERIRRFRCGGR